MAHPVMSDVGSRLLNLLGDCKYEITPFGGEALTCEAVEKITGLGAANIGKAMVVNVDGRPMIVLLAGSSRLNVKAVKTVLGAKKVSLLSPQDASRATGLTLGAITPLIALERVDIQVIADRSLCSHACINISSGDPAFGVNINPNQLIGKIRAQIVSIQQE